MENLESRSLSYTMVGEFLLDLKEEFDRRDNKTMKMAKLKKVEQESKTIKEFIQEFRRAVRESGYERQPLIEEFKREINKVIRKKLIEAKRSLRIIDQ